MTNPVIHSEIGGRDLATMTAFYDEPSGWSPLPTPADYALVSTEAAAS